MKIEKIDNNLFVNDDSIVQVKKTGNITEIKTCLRECKQTIRKISAQEYIVLDTGELKQYKHTEKRIENPTSLKQSMRNLRDIINTNCTDPIKCKFLTLTYRGASQNDPKELYIDVKNFHKRLRYFLRDIKFQYISVIEPHGNNTGGFHVHEILVFVDKAPFIPNSRIEEIWGNGFTKTTKIDGVEKIDSVKNIGTYLTSYLCDIPIEQTDLKDIKSLSNIKEVQTTDENGKPISKHIIKGGRLKYYPKGMRFYRCSRGIKRPEVIKCPYSVAKDMVKNSVLTYEKTIKISDDNNDAVLNIINYKQYNSKAKKG